MIVKVFDSRLDLDKLRYDLAFAHANILASAALASGRFNGIDVPKEIQQIHYLSEEFCDAFSELANCNDEYFVHLLSGGDDSSDFVSLESE